MTKLKGWIAVPATVGLLLMSGCGNIPYYDQSLGWFSQSRYDPTIKEIEAENPPQPIPADQAMLRDTHGGYVYADPPPGVTVSLGATPLASRAAVDAAGKVSVADASNSPGTGNGAPLVGIRNSVPGSVTWRSARGTP